MDRRSSSSVLADLSRKFVPVYNEIKRAGVRILQERAAARQLVQRRQLLDELEAQLRSRRTATAAASSSSTRSRLLVRSTRQPAAPSSFLAVQRQKWAAANSAASIANEEEDEEDELLPSSSSMYSLLGGPAAGEGDEEGVEDEYAAAIGLLPPQQPSKKKKQQQAAASSQQAPPHTPRPDPFTTSAPLYADTFGARLVCRTCDYTLSRGARGVHLFSWHSNNHLAINEELTDTMVFKPRPAAVDNNHQSKWKIAKAACPCCGTSVGSMGYTESSIKVLIKGVSVAWRRPVNQNKLAARTFYALVERPQALIFPSTWLYSQAGLMTHTRRWVLDTPTLNKAVTNTKLLHVDERWKTTTPDANSILRAMESEPKPVSELMAVLAARAMAIESISVGFAGAQQQQQEAILEYTLGALEQISSRLEALAAGEEETGQLQRAALETSLVVVRAACLAKLGIEASASLGETSAVAALLMDETKADLLAAAAAASAAVEDGSDGGQAVALIPARSLCAIAKLFAHDRDVLVAICQLLVARKLAFGDSAAAFGRSAEYLKRAVQQQQNDAELDALVSKCTVPHPSPGARFGGQLDANGFVELFCQHAECNRRATHASAELPPVRRIPTHCRVHAPAAFVAPGALLLDRDANSAAGAGASGGSSTYPPSFRFGNNFNQNRRPNAIVNVPDPEASPHEFGPAPAGTLFLGKRFQESIEFVRTPEELAEAVQYFEKHLSDAAEAGGAEAPPSLQYAIGLDVEWKPEFFFNADNNVASICQVSTRDRHFVFDMIQLTTSGGATAALSGLFRQLYTSRAVIKLGHGLGEDLSRVAQHLAAAKLGGDKRHADLVVEAKAFFPCESVLELTPLYSKSENKSFTGGAMPSLVAMVQAATGLKLDKQCQMTDWERRPLSPMQLRYASTDAACAFVLLDYFVGKIELQQQQGGEGEEAAAKLDIAPYLTTDQGNVQPQRGQTPPAVSTSFVMDGTFGARTLLRPAVVAAAEASSSSKPSPLLSAHKTGNFQASSAGAAATAASMSSSSSGGALQTTPTLSFLKRLQELRTDLESQGVKVDEHSSAEGLVVATEHLERSLDRVVRDTLVD